MRYIKLFENFETKDDIIEKIKSLEYILKDENLQIHRYGSRYDTPKKLTISLRVGTTNRYRSFQELRNEIPDTSLNIEGVIKEDFFLEYIDRIEQLCHDEKVFNSIDQIDVRLNGNTFVFIDKNGQTSGIAFKPREKEMIVGNPYGDDYENPNL